MLCLIHEVILRLKLENKKGADMASFLLMINNSQKKGKYYRSLEIDVVLC